MSIIVYLFSTYLYLTFKLTLKAHTGAGADPGFFLGGGALVSCSASTPINHIVFFFFCRIPVALENRRSSRGGGGCAHPLHPPPRSAPAEGSKVQPPGGGGGGGVLLGILGRGVPPGSPNPDPIWDQNMSFFTPIFRPVSKNPYPFSAPAQKLVRLTCGKFSLIIEFLKGLYFCSCLAWNSSVENSTCDVMTIDQ